jgi:hypothetical protein
MYYINIAFLTLSETTQSKAIASMILGLQGMHSAQDNFLGE